MFILYITMITCRYSHFNILFSSPCQRQCGLLASVVCCLSSVNFSHFNLLKPISQMNWNLVGSIYGRSSLKSAHFVMNHYQTWPSTWFLNGQFKQNLLLWDCLAKLTETCQEQEASMEFPLWRMLISSRSVNKHGHHRQFFFLIGRYLKYILLWNCLAKWTETW
jgi:hypothetical protein